MFARMVKQGVRLASDAVRVGLVGIGIFLCIRRVRAGLLEIVGDCG
jgi:hypothetical protein